MIKIDNFRFGAVGTLVACLVTTACSSSVVAPAISASPTPLGPAQSAVTRPAPATEAPTSEQPASPPPAERTAIPTSSAESTTPSDGSTETYVAGSWVGTITEDSSSQGIRFSLNQVLGVITGAALLDSGDVQQVKAMLDGNSLTLTYSGGVQVVYEGTIDGDSYDGTFTRSLSDRVVGTGTFETTRQE